MKNYKKLYKKLFLENESLKKECDHKSEQVLNLLDRNRVLKEENYKQRSDIKYYNGISELLEKYHNYMTKDINLLLDKEIIENYIKLFKAARGDK